jgi:hypothetical protein
METVDDLILKANHLAKYYYKGFGNVIWGTNIQLEAFLYFKKEEKYFERFERIINPLLDYYKKISFENLFNEKEFYPLFVVDELLKKYSHESKIFFENPNESKMKEVFNIGKSIIEIGSKYDEYFNNILWKIREFPEYQDYQMKIKDYRGLEFVFPNLPNTS